ncbi:bi-domain-containing oxidoreductase [Haloferacaceae archaeon DSL9]
MKQIIQNFKDGEMDVKNVPEPDCKPEGILVKNHYSSVSAGTEESAIKLAKKNLLNKARQRPDLAKQVIDKARNDGLMSTYQAVMGRLEEPAPLGYSCAGEVIEVGSKVNSFSEGDLVACGGAGYASHAEVVYVPKNLAVKVPDGVAMDDAAFVTIGAIAMQGVRRADLSPGENVAVLGLGLIGQLTVQILKAYGSPVLGIDISPSQVEKGYAAGIDQGAVIGSDDVEGIADAFTDSNGVDAVIITASTDSDQPVQMAGRICREQGRISAVGAVGMDIPRNEYYEKELDMRVSRSYGPGRYDTRYEEKGLDYPIEYVRWTENRNMGEFLRLVGEGRVGLDQLKTHQFSIDDALDAYDLILNNPDNEDYTGILLEYDPTKKHTQTVRLNSTKKTGVTGSTISTALIGGGNFAKSTILPAIEKIDEIDLRAVASSTGKNAEDIGQKHDCDYVTTDYREIIDDDSIDWIIIATRHGTHAEIATKALKQDKNVHVEKPLALNREQLRQVVEAEQQSSGRLMVGFNRRFAPAAVNAKETFEQRTTPLMMNYRVAAEQIPEDHWVYDEEDGGGRIIGEICHFVDLAQYLTDSLPVSVYATPISTDRRPLGDDNVNIVVKFADGSTATIMYTTIADSSTAKEQLEIFGAGKTEVINNYSTGRLSLGQDKGHAAEFQAFADAIHQNDPSPIDIESLVATTLATYGIRDSMKQASSVEIDLAFESEESTKENDGKEVAPSSK